jgi:predicted phage terminase large subunit-like protein
MGTATRTEKQADEASLFDLRKQARLAAARTAAREKDILTWGEALFPEKFELPYCQEMHGDFVAIRGEAFTDREAPRNHAKTTVKCFLIPLFQALEEPETFRHYINVQATKTKAVEVNRAIKLELESNDLLREMYGDMIGERWTDGQFVLTNGVIFTALGAGQSVRGINYRNKRPDYFLIDDLYDEDDIYNPASTIKKNKWFWGSLYLARAKSRRCSIHVQGTAINNYDLLEELKTKEGVNCRTFRAVKDFEKKIVLWPELNSFESVLVDLGRMGPIIGPRELQNERMDEHTAILKREYWKRYTKLPSGFDMVITSWDMSFKETKSGSFVVGQAWGRRGADFYLFPVMKRARMGFVRALEAVLELARAYPQATGHLVEEKANGSAVMAMLAKKVPGLVPILPHGSKVARAAAITPPLAGGNVWIPDDSLCDIDPDTKKPWVLGFIDECSKFTGADTEINDQVDTTTQAINYLNQMRYDDDDGDDDGSFIDAAVAAGGFSE